ncbi:related to TGF beta induced protein ig-h3 precursor [Rhynchosporium secalis]|uniref:Related to TGF beta induced protein ig-h3 n=1 Tax=Rhynchosporium secalis TaxID=38038 RepID=A0A1E1MLR9_RHYSE|nr:related to TGF beta induced protein ig-h3 precursor [Rhynchosporium secalis]
MQIKSLLPAAFIAGASAQSLVEVLAANNGTLSALTTLISSQPDLVQSLSQAKNITILAPSNAAIAAFLNSTAGVAAASNPGAVAALLSYHVLSGSYPASAFTNTSQFIPTLLTDPAYSNVTGGQVVDAKVEGETVSIFTGLISDSNVTAADVKFDGGVVHVINKLLTVPPSASNSAVALGLTSLAGALTTANLVSTVDGLKDVTIFAPSNEAFAALGSANISIEALTSTLTYHVVQGTVGYSTLLSNTTLPTVNGGNVTITVVNDNVYVNAAKVTIPDVLVAGGVVHVIDSVLNPANSTAKPPGTVSPPVSGATQIQTGLMGLGAFLAGAAILLANL